MPSRPSLDDARLLTALPHNIKTIPDVYFWVKDVLKKYPTLSLEDEEKCFQNVIFFFSADYPIFKAVLRMTYNVTDPPVSLFLSRMVGVSAIWHLQNSAMGAVFALLYDLLCLPLWTALMPDSRPLPRNAKPHTRRFVLGLLFHAVHECFQEGSGCLYAQLKQ
jgi:hypothetical protein